MNTNITVSEVLNTVLNIKVAYLLLGIVGLIIIGLAIYGVIKIIQNIQAKRTANLKIAPLAILGASISWKVIVYVLAFAIAGGTGYGIYKKLTEKTTSNTYTNVVAKAQEVKIDQRQIFPDKKYIFRFELLGIDIHFIDVTPKIPVIINNKVEVTPIAPVTPPAKKSIFTFMNILIGITGLGIVVVGIHYITLLLKKKPVTPPAGV